MKRTGTANWIGSGKEGKGTVSVQSGLIQQAQYSYTSRFENGIGTNPEELIAAAHAGCFSMKLSFVLGTAGFIPDSIETTCTITLESGSITSSHLKVTAKVPGVSQEKFLVCAEDAKSGCPVSKALGIPVTLEAILASAPQSV